MRLISNKENNPPDTQKGITVVDLYFKNIPTINGQEESRYRLLMKKHHAKEFIEKFRPEEI